MIDIQRITHEAALGLHDDFLGTSDREERARVASAISNLGKAWCSLQDAKREILGRPKAGVLKPERPKPKRKPYWEMPTPIFEDSPGDAPSAENKPPADDVKWEMRDVPGHPGMQVQVVLDSPALRVERANQAQAAAPLPTSPLTSPAPNPPQPTHPAERPAIPPAPRARMPSAPIPSPMIIREPPLPPSAVRRQLVHGPDGRLVWKPEKS